MKICAITMVYKDYWALSQWYIHYGRLVGFENLYVVAHGHDIEIGRICPKASIITIPRDDLEGFDRKRARILNSFQDGLGLSYDWVIRTDADELVCYDPAIYLDLSDVLGRSTENFIFGLGLNVSESIKDCLLSPNQMALGHRKNATFSGHYSKAWAVKRGTSLWRHGIWTGKRKIDRIKFNMPVGVYIAHLKYSNVAALEDVNTVRIEVATTEGCGLPGSSWRDADLDADRFYNRFSALRVEKWKQAKDSAYKMITDCPVRDGEENVLRSKSVVFENRVILPDWFATRFGLDP